MTDFPANPNGEWAIYSAQKADPGWLGGIETKLGWVHNYLVLVDPKGNPVEELHGWPTGQFTLGSPVAGDYLGGGETFPNAYHNYPTISEKLVMAGSQDQMVHSFNTANDTVQNALNTHQFLYVGASLNEPAYNSNSVWYTAMKSMGVKDPSQYEVFHNVPGDNLDLTHLHGNLHDTSFAGNLFNGFIGAVGHAEDMYAANPVAVTGAAAAITLAGLLTSTALVSRHRQKEAEKPAQAPSR